MIDTAANSTASTRTRRILSIDGGGIAGTLPASFLCALEEDIGQPIGSYFDLIAGVHRRHPRARPQPGALCKGVAQSYVKRGPQYFGNNAVWSDHKKAGPLRAAVVGPKHDVDKLRAELTPILKDHRSGMPRRAC